MWRFGPYRLVGPGGPLKRRAQIVHLPPKALAVLWELVSHAGEVVTKEVLLSTVWPDLVVTDGVLTACVRDLRHALADDPKTPRYIATVHRVGYRFMATVSGEERAISDPELPVVSVHAQRIVESRQAEDFLVGRESEFGHLERLLAKALAGQRQMVFVTGEAGIGKTTLVEGFLSRIADRYGPSVGQGQCVEHYGAGEAFLPVIEALGRMGRAPSGRRVVEILRQYAPSWLVQIPTLVDAKVLDTLRRDTQGVTKGRMLRELVEGLEALSAEQLVVVVFEDLHWCDPSTVEWLAMVARRPEAARLLVLGTYRPVDLMATHHPLQTAKQELVAKGQGVEIPLGPLEAEAVHAFVDRRLDGKAANRSLGAFVYRRTGGHPLFMVQVTEYLARGATAVGDTAIEQAVPQGLRELIEAQIGRLSVDEQQVLEVASVAGVEFAVASVAAGGLKSASAVEAVCERLARHGQFIEDRGLSVWPDGTVGGCYGFRHALYLDVLRARMGAGQRARLQLVIGECKAAGYGREATKIAAELALHFEEGGDVRRAMLYHDQAARNALWRGAQQEAIAHLEKALKLLRALEDTVERARQELSLQIALGRSLMAVKGWASSEAGNAYHRARDLCQRVGEPLVLFETLMGLFEFHLVHGDVSVALDLAEQMHALAQRAARADFLVRAETMLGMALFYLGRFLEAQNHLEIVVSIYRKDEHHPLVCGAVQDSRVASLCYLTSILWLRGYPDRALDETMQSLQMAQELAHPFSVAWSLDFAARLHLFRGEGHAAAQRAEALVMVATEHEFASWMAEGKIALGSALVEQGRARKGIARIRHGLSASQKIGGPAIDHPFYRGLLAAACGQVGQWTEGVQVLAEALILVDVTGERWYEAELRRLKGELFLQQATVNSEQAAGEYRASWFSGVWQAECCFREAIAIARRQQATSLELRASVSLARLWWWHQDKIMEAQRMLAAVYERFTEGFETKDLREAKTLLTALAECIESRAIRRTESER